MQAANIDVCIVVMPCANHGEQVSGCALDAVSTGPNLLTQRNRSPLLAGAYVQENEANPSPALVVLRLGTFFGCVALAAYAFWSMFSEDAALRRLAATAEGYQYTRRCDDNGQLVATGKLNCVDLNHYVFVYGPVSRAFRRSCRGKPAAMLLIEKGKVATGEINLIEKMLRFRARFGANSPCGPPGSRPNASP